MPAGHLWAPGARVRTIEIPPIVLWDRKDPRWTLEDFKPCPVRRTEGTLFESGRRQRAQATVFVAYRMDFPQSREFRNRLDAILSGRPGPLRLNVTDGRVREGEDWAPVIRTRIKKAELVVGDVTGMRNDVVFELGFAYGLRKPFIPVVESPNRREDVPYWLRSKQIGCYTTEHELLSVASSVTAHIADPSVTRPRRLRDAVPGLAIWLGPPDHLEDRAAQFRAECSREGLTCECVALIDRDESIIERAARANILAVVLTGRETDSLVHYVCGAIVARPKAGYGSSTLDRYVLVVAEGLVTDLAADSLMRCRDVVAAPPGGELRSQIASVGRAYRKWIEAGAKRKKD